MKTLLELIAQAKSQICECNRQSIQEAIGCCALIIDVREPDEFSQAAIETAINIPRGILEFTILQHPEVINRLDPKDPGCTPIFLYCKSGGRSALAAQSLKMMGFNNVSSLSCGFDGWCTNVREAI